MTQLTLAPVPPTPERTDTRKLPACSAPGCTRPPMVWSAVHGRLCDHHRRGRGWEG